MTQTPSKGAVFDALRAQAPRALHVGELCGRLGVPKDRRDEVIDLLDELCAMGLAREMPGLRFRATKQADRPPRPSREVEVSGRLTVNPRGFGFVATEDSGGDVFIPAERLAGAMQGDRVRVVARPSAKGRDGEVLEILARGRKLLGGTLRKTRRTWVVEPDDPRVPGPYPLEGDVPRDVHAGQMVVVEIVDYPRGPDEPPRVRFVEVLGEPGEIGVEVRALELKHAIVEPFPEDVLTEAQDVPTTLPRDEVKRREDLRHLDLVTIDPIDARDHDDAVWGERLPDGGWRVVVAIADVSHYVRPGTAIDREAFTRGTSVYLPDRSIPMLPPEISSTMASLVPGEDRFTVAVEVELGPRAAIQKHRFIEGVMRSPARLDYGGVARALGLTEEPAGSPEAERRVDMLRELFALTRQLRARRSRRGSLDFDLPEAKVLLDPTTGAPRDVVRQKGDPGVRQAYSLIEELMLLANEVVAAELGRLGVPTIYRVHGEPDEDKLAKFANLASSLGHGLSPDDATDPRKLSSFLKKVEGSPNAGALNYLLLRSMQQAVYDVTNIGHFGLAAKDYLHFTSPIRRYPDLVVHRILKEVIRGEAVKTPQREQELRTQAAESSRNERRANDLERDVVDLYRVFLMRDRIGEELDGTVSGVAEHGFYTTFDEPFVDALTPVERLGDDFYEPDELGLRLVGRRSGKSFGLGDRVRVRLEEASLERRQLVAIPVAFVTPARRRTRGRAPEAQELDDVDAQYVEATEDEANDRPPWQRLLDEDGGRRTPGRGRADDRSGSGRSGARRSGSGRGGAGRSSAGRSDSGRTDSVRSGSGRSGSGRSDSGRSERKKPATGGKRAPAGGKGGGGKVSGGGKGGGGKASGGGKRTGEPGKKPTSGGKKRGGGKKR